MTDFFQTYDKHIFTFAVKPILIQNISAWNKVLASVAQCEEKLRNRRKNKRRRLS